MDNQILLLDPALISQVVRRAVEEHFSAPEVTGLPQQLFHSPRAQALKEEIVASGRKLWQRQYVDGNGGNISCRLSSQHILCTPTMVSKGDLRPGDLSLVDLENNHILGELPPTSEIRLHLEIYKAVPEAQAVIHCHPPYATAHAVAGVIPQGNLVPEQEVFIGPVVLAPYETPGTAAFARTVLPMVRQHNTILLANHGIVCWADTVTHAEWYAEIIDTYCKTVMIAGQLRSSLTEIPADKVKDLLEIKKRLGLPDARLPLAEAEAPSTAPAPEPGTAPAPRVLNRRDIDKLAGTITEELLKLVEIRA